MIARVAAALVMSVVAASCAGGDDDPPAQSTTLASTAPSTTTTPTSAPAAAPRLELRGLGPVRVGMTVAEAAAALGVELEPATAPTPACTLYAPASGWEGVAFLVANGVVARVDVTAGATATAEGLALGQSETEAQQRYGDRLRVSDHDLLLGGHYLTLVPTAREDAGFRLVVETDGHRVTALRAGRLPEVELTEGCA